MRIDSPPALVHLALILIGWPEGHVINHTHYGPTLQEGEEAGETRGDDRTCAGYQRGAEGQADGRSGGAPAGARKGDEGVDDTG